MKLKKLLKDEQGAVLPLVTIILGLFALGFIALIIDVGTLYVERKAMITSADAAALAGTDILRVSKGANSSDAKLAAEDYARANGASQVTVKVDPLKSVILPSGETECRQVVEVTVVKNQPLIFARFLGDENADVKAHAIATWGYVYKTYIDTFPLFIFDITAESDGKIKTDTDIFLHDKYDSSNNSYGLVDMGTGKNGIKAAIASESGTGTYTYTSADGTVVLNGEPGQATSIGNSVEERMKLAQTKDTPMARKETMIVIVPVINHEKFLTIAGNDGGNANSYQLPIKYFAYFEIKDLIKKNSFMGSAEALDPNNEYKKVSTPFNHSSLLAGESADYTFIYGEFTGETVEANVIITKNDQINPDNGGNAPATYSKLIK